jgi:uncharacterized protein
MTAAGEPGPDVGATESAGDAVAEAVAEQVAEPTAERVADTGGEPAPDAAAPAPFEPWHLATVVDVRMDLPAANPEVVLQESAAPWRRLHIPVGMAEGNAIAHALRDVATPRPLTHALFAEVLERHGVEVEAARITARQGRLFSAELDTTGARGRHVVPCRPSDAIALLLRQRLPTPLLVGEWVFDNAQDGAADS